MEPGQEDVSQAEQNKTKHQETAAPRNRSGHLQFTNTHGRQQQITAPLSNLPMENAETGSEGNSTETPGSNESKAKVGHLPSH
jgi:hypothetical protein